MRRLVRLIQSQIRYKIILPYLSLMLLVTLSGATIALALTAASWQERLTEQLIQIGRSSSTALLQRERDHLAFLYLVALAQANPDAKALSMGDAFASKNPAEIEKAISPLYAYQRQFKDTLDVDRFIAFDTAGKAYIDWLRVSDATAPANIPGTNLGAVPTIQQVLKSSTGDSIDKYANLIQFNPDPQPYFYTVVPVSRGDQVVGGVLIGVKIDRMLTLFERTSQSVVTNYYSLDGRATGSSLLRREVDLPNFVMRPQTLQQLEAGKQGTVFDRLQLLGHDYEFAYSPLVIAQTQVGYFSVALSSDFQAESLSLSRNAVLLITFLLAIGAVFVGYRIARSITLPLNALVNTAEAVSAGDLERRTTIESQDELGRLASAFNQMTEHLLRLYTTSRDLSTQIDVDAVLHVSGETANALVPGTESFALLDDRGNWTYHLPAGSSAALRTLEDLHLSTEDPLLNELARERQQCVLGQADPLLATSGLINLAGLKQVLLTPLLIQDTLVGVMIFGHAQPAAFTAATLPTLTATANMSASVLYNAVLFGQVNEEAGERKAILESIADGVIVVDTAQTIVLVNDAAQHMLGSTAPQLLRRSFDTLPLELVPATQDIFGEARVGIEHYRIGEHMLTLSSAPVNVDGRAIGRVFVLHDISAEAAVDAAKTEFIATISHELRTPLTPIYSYIELLQRGVYGAMNSDQREIIDVIHNRAEQLKDLINNIVMVASIQSNTLATEQEALDFGAVVETTVAPMQRALDKKNLALVLDIPPDLPQVYADREHLRLILTQLLDNARRYTATGAITIRVARHEQILQVDVEDSGAGIPPERIGRLFTRFNRIDGNSSQERGGGLGLAITRQLVERQGGQVWAQSEVGRGSTFSFSLPVANGHVDAILESDATNTAA